MQHEAPCELQHWAIVHGHAREAADAWQAAFGDSIGSTSGRLRLSSAQSEPCTAELLDLATLCGLHGECPGLTIVAL